MDKLKMETQDLAQMNIEKIGEMFPNVVTETRGEDGKLKKAVNFELLKQMLSDEVLSGDEAYEFTWVGKKTSIVEANKPIRKTLRPCKEESKNWDTTENLYIEGDNLEVLKLLQESYLGKVKMIYIDPPYNTGNDFIYHDNYRADDEKYNETIKLFDDDMNKQFCENTVSNPRIHSDWCSMVYSRLVLSRNLLRNDGIIFISIDDHEIAQLLKICDETYGNSNFVAIINWKGRGGRQDSKYYAAVHEYILCYAKNKTCFQAGEEIKSGDVYPKYDEGKKRYYKTQLLRKWGSNSRREDRPNLYYPITAPDGSDVYPMLSYETNESSSNSRKMEGRWRWGVSTMKKALHDEQIEFVKQSDNSWIPYEKIYAPLEGEEKTKKYTTWIDESNDGAKIINELFGCTVFDYPKSPSLLLKFLKMADVEDGDIVLDFFSGSASTAHAVMQLNAEDGGNRSFIMVQLQEPCDEKSEAYKAGYKNICEIGKERIRRAGEKIVADLLEDAKGEKVFDDIAQHFQLTLEEDHGKKAISKREIANNLDIGFRVLKLDDTNMKDVYYSADEYDQKMLVGLESNIKEDRTDLDLLFGCLLDWGLPLSMPCTSETINGNTVHIYNNGDLIACFDDNVPESVIREIAKRLPLRAVFRDSSFSSSPERINVEEIFKLLSPNTTVKVI